MIKTKNYFFEGMNYNATASSSWWYIGHFCIPYWNATYLDKFEPIIKPLMIIQNFMTEVFFNKKNYYLMFTMLEEFLTLIYIIGNDVYNIILFDPNTLNYSQSFTVSISFQIQSLYTQGITNW